MFRTEKRREVEEEQIPSQQAKKHLKRKIDAWINKKGEKSNDQWKSKNGITWNFGARLEST